MLPTAPASDRWWESHVPVPRDSSHARTALVSVGVPLAGLGASMLLGSGIAAIIAWSSASDLEAQCPGKLCVEGTPGGRSYVRARDASRAAEVMAALGFPTVAVGAVLLVFTAGTEKPAAAGAPPRVTVQVGPTSGALEVRF